MQLSWWKLLCIVLLAYVLVIGLITPLKPGILKISPERIKTGQTVDIEISGYNTHYKSSNQFAYLKASTGHLIQSKEIKVIDDNNMVASFDVPQFLPTSSSIEQLSLITSSEKDGSSVMPSRLIVSQDSVQLEMGKNLWSIKEPTFFGIKKYSFPFRNILYETIRNTFFHVSLWFAMFALLGISVYHSIRYLYKSDLLDDWKAYSQVRTAILFGVLGLITGSIWAKYTWGTWWTNDIKLNMAALSMLIYFGYLIIRAGIEDPDKKARISASFNVFALVAVIPLIFVLPRLTDSLHPGNGGNPAFGSEDMDNSLRMVFYPAVISFILLGIWLSQLVFRSDVLSHKSESAEI